MYIKQIASISFLFNIDSIEVRIVFTLSIEIFYFVRERKREKERDELWKKLNELEVERRNALTVNSNSFNTPVLATTAPTTQVRP